MFEETLKAKHDYLLMCYCNVSVPRKVNFKVKYICVQVYENDIDTVFQPFTSDNNWNGLWNFSLNKIKNCILTFMLLCFCETSVSY